MKNRVEQGERIMESIREIPFLLRFHNGSTFSSKLINEYMGYCHIDFQSVLTAESLNVVLIEAEKRGDL